jgi:hypothetical protein
MPQVRSSQQSHSWTSVLWQTYSSLTGSEPNIAIPTPEDHFSHLFSRSFPQLVNVSPDILATTIGDTSIYCRC